MRPTLSARLHRYWRILNPRSLFLAVFYFFVFGIHDVAVILLATFGLAGIRASTRRVLLFRLLFLVYLLGELLRLAARLLLLSMIPLTLGLCIDFYLVARVISDSTIAAGFAGGLLGVFILLWFVLPRAWGRDGPSRT